MIVVSRSRDLSSYSSQRRRNDNLLNLDDFVLRMGGEKDWENGISEEYRLDRRVLNALPHSCFSELEIWEHFVDLKFTKHATQRLMSYVGKVSEKPWNGEEYIELYSQEFDFLKKVSNMQSLLKHCKRVELGLNRFGKVCKVSYVLDLTEHCPQLYSNQGHESRWLFFCVGVDGSIKTINITPDEKKKEQYGGTIQYIGLNDLLCNSLFYE